MLLSRLCALTTVAAVLVTVTACGRSSGGSSPAGSTGGSNASTASTSVAIAAASSSGSGSGGSTSDVPSFANGGSVLADTGHLVYVLKAVNPKIGTNKDDLVAKTKALCAHVNADESESQLEGEAAKGFTKGAWVPSQPEAQAIVGTVKAYGGC